MTEVFAVGNWLTVMLSVASFIVLLARISELSWRVHRPPVMGFHLALAIACIWSGWRGWAGVAEFGDLCTATAAMCWIVGSFQNWRHGPPPETESGSMPLDEAK